MGDDFYTSIDAELIQAPGLASWQVNIQYDPAVVSLVDVIWGDDLGSTGRQVITLGPNTSTEGEVFLGAFTLGDGPGPTGTVHLATLHWQGVSAGTSPLKLAPLDKQKLVDTNSQTLSPLELVSSQITISGATAVRDAMQQDAVIVNPGIHASWYYHGVYYELQTCPLIWPQDFQATCRFWLPVMWSGSLP